MGVDKLGVDKMGSRQSRMTCCVNFWILISQFPIRICAGLSMGL